MRVWWITSRNFLRMPYTHCTVLGCCLSSVMLHVGHFHSTDDDDMLSGTNVIAVAGLDVVW